MRIPLSFRQHNRNCAHDIGSTARFASQSRSVAGWMLMLMLLALEWLAGRVSARGAVVVAPHISLVVFTDRSMPDEQWSTLAVTLRQGFVDLAVETHFAAGEFDVVRGNTLAPGVQFDKVISIYLHGDCRVPFYPVTHTVNGALGWVLRDGGQIQPFIHVDCGRIAEMLGQRAFGMGRNSRNAAIAEAVSRVILHEWLHIATQNAAHSRDGITKPSFSVQDLVPDFPQLVSHGR